MMRTALQYFFILARSFSITFLPTWSCHFWEALVKAFFLDLCLGKEMCEGLYHKHLAWRKRPNTLTEQCQQELAVTPWVLCSSKLSTRWLGLHGVKSSEKTAMMNQKQRTDHTHSLILSARGVMEC